jgi:hypothetical protein
MTLEELLVEINERSYRISNGLPVEQRFQAFTEDGQIFVKDMWHEKRKKRYKTKKT